MQSESQSGILPSPPVETLMMVNAMADPALIIGPDYRIVHVNPAYESRFGLTGRKVRGLPCYEVSHHRNEPCDSPEDPCPLKEVMRTGKLVFVTHTHYTEAGEEVTVQVEGIPLRDEQGEVTRMLEIVKDLPSKAP